MLSLLVHHLKKHKTHFARGYEHIVFIVDGIIAMHLMNLLTLYLCHKGG